MPTEQRKDNVTPKSSTGGVSAMCVVCVDKSSLFRFFIKLAGIILLALLYLYGLQNAEKKSVESFLFYYND